MNCIRQELPGVLRYGALHYAHRTLKSMDVVQDQVNIDLLDSNLALQDLKDNTVLLDFRCEGQCDKIIKNLILYLRSIPVKDVVAVFNTDVDPAALDYAAVTVVDHLCNYDSWFTELQQNPMIWETDCNFLCLMGSVRKSRALLARQLLERFQSMRISFGSLGAPEECRPYQPLLPNHQLPLLLDGTIKRGHTGLESSVINPMFRKCAVNIIAESSAQHDQDVWNSVFVTEKTFKAFGMLQIPIWWAVPGVVACVRKMGFDLFDDIVDHSYDQEHNQAARLGLVLNQISRLQDLNPAQLRIQLKPRLAENHQRLHSMVQRQSGQFRRILKDLNLDITT